LSVTIGTKLGSYEITAPIGTGGMGEVYRARDMKLKREVAIKTLPEEFSRNPERVARFQREAEILASLNHPNIATIYDLEEADGVRFLVLELVEGATLAERMVRGPIPFEEALPICRQIVDGLKAAHEKGVVHRDLKPGNIKITPAGAVKILDFGLSKITRPAAPADTVTQLTDSGILLGTIGYMSPEHFRGVNANVRSDIFSVGAILYELLSGRRAFKGGSGAETICAILEKDPPALSSLGTSAPVQFLRIVSRCLEKEPSKRFQSAAELKFALECSTDSPPAAKPPEKSIAVLPFVNTSSTDQEYFSDGLAEELINALAQLPGLRVASRSSSFRFRGSDLDVREIGRKLGVETLLEGSVRRAGNRLRVTAQLISIEDGYHLWSERYDRDMADVFAIQDEITQSIVQKLEPRLLGQTRPASRRHTGSPEAFELYLKGRHLWHQRTESSLRSGIHCFTKAIEIDPEYALAHAGLADSFSAMRAWGYASAAEASARTQAAAQRAMELDPMLAEAHFAMALYRLWFSDDWPGAEPHFRRALELQPRSSTILIYIAVFLSARQRFDEAFGYMDKAIEIDSQAPFVYGFGALVMYNARRYERAVEHAERALALHPDFAFGLYVLGLAACQMDQCNRGIEACSRLVAITNRAAQPMGMLGYAYALSGRLADAMLLLDELSDRSSTHYIDPMAAVLIYAGLQDLDNVKRALERLIEIHGCFASVGMVLTPTFDRLRAEPKIEALLRRFHHPPRFEALA